MLLPNLEDQSNQPPELASRPPEAASAALLGLDGSAAQIGDRGQLSVRAYHAPSGTLSITEYYAP